jgi:hypothetical protein
MRGRTRVATMDDWHSQEAVIQARSRERNESVAKLGGKGGVNDCMETFSCECGDPDCRGHVCLSTAEYESVRAHADRFVIVANHENPEVERVVVEGTRFAVIQTLTGEASKTALRSNPRRVWPIGG